MHKLLLPLILLLTATGGIAALTGAGEAADRLWGLATLPVLVPFRWMNLPSPGSRCLSAIPTARRWPAAR